MYVFGVVNWKKKTIRKQKEQGSDRTEDAPGTTYQVVRTAQHVVTFNYVPGIDFFFLVGSGK